MSPYYNRRQQNNQPSNNQPKQSAETDFYNTVDEAIAAYYDYQPKRVVTNLKASGYEIVRMGVRKTKTEGVPMFRAYVKVNKAHGKNYQKANAANLVRNVFPGVGEISFYQPDYEAMDTICVVWFAFDVRPINK